MSYPGHDFLLSLSRHKGHFDARQWHRVDLVCVRPGQLPLNNEAVTNEVMAWLDEQRVPVVVVQPEHPQAPHQFWFWHMRDAVHFKLRWRDNG